MRATVVVIVALILLAAAALIVFLGTARFDTTLDFRFHDAVSGQWVWNATATIEDRVIRAFYQSDAGPVPFSFSHLAPGAATLAISAPGYVPVSVPLELRRGANHLPQPISMVGYEIPNLDHFVVFEQADGAGLAGELRPVGTDGRAVQNHPCISIWVGGRITVEMRHGVPAEQQGDSGNSRGQELFSGRISWAWDPSPETVFRYTFRIPGSMIAESEAPYRVVDYLVVVPDPRRISTDELDAVMRSAPPLSNESALKSYLAGQGDRLRFFFDTSWNVPRGPG